MSGDWREDRVGAAHRGENPMVMARMRSGFAVIGDTQHLPGYSVLMYEDDTVEHLADLDLRRRGEFLVDLALLGEAVGIACRGDDLRRVNYEVLGNSIPWLHGHVHARYRWEAPDRVTMPVWCYPPEERNAPEAAYDDVRDGPLRERIAAELTRLMAAAYGGTALPPAPATATTTAVGIDVGGRRKGFHACAVRGREVVAGPTQLADVEAAVAWVVAQEPAAVALDSPRTCAPPGECSRADERALNREVCGIRWTPERSLLAGNPYYEWIEHGLELYDALAAAGIDRERLIEVFPTAAWTIWAGPRGERRRGDWSAAALADLGLAGLPGRRFSQDDRDAVAAAVVAQLHTEGRSRAFGEIIVPADASPAGRRTARTSPAPPAVVRDRRAPGRRG